MVESTGSLQVPSVDGVRELCAKFYPNAPAQSEESGLSEVANFTPGYACMILDDDDQIVGAIAANLQAAALFGGKHLMMLPEAPLLEQIQAGDLSPEVVDGISEVFNHLTIAFNQVGGNPHIRSLAARPIAEFVASEDGKWLASPGANLVLKADAFGAESMLWLVARG